MIRPRKVLLLNPPGRRRYLRDCYCSSIDKAGYYWHPFDLVTQSGWLSQSFTVELLDAIVEKLSPRAALARAVTGRYDAVLALTSQLSWSEDETFFRELKERTGALLFVSGDLPRFRSGPLLQEAPFLDGALLDLTAPDLCTYLATGTWSAEAAVARRASGAIIEGQVAPGRPFSYPHPRFDLFWKQPYRFPLPLPEPIASTVFLHGCPYHCAFCNTGELHLRTREWDNFADELHWLAGQGVRGLLLREATFNWNIEVVNRFCDLLAAMKWDVQWFCYARVDTLDETTIERLARSGCRYLGVGIESGSPDLLRLYKDRYDRQALPAALQACRRHGIATLGHFILGLPGETAATLAETSRWAAALPLDYASFNLFTPRTGASLLGKTVTVATARSAAQPLSHAPGLSLSELRRARGKMVRQFYLRPSYIWRRVRQLPNLAAFFQHLRQGSRLLISSFFSDR